MKNKKGFTLIELLVVISIIALLISILMPALGKARLQARFTVCKTRQRSILNAINIYTSDHDGKLPPSTQGKKDGWWTIPMRLKYYYTPDDSGAGLNGGSALKFLGSYMKSGEYFDCPMANHDTGWQDDYFEAMTSDTVSFLNCSYFLLWNWKRVEKVKPSFVLKDGGKDHLAVCDFLIYNESYNNNYNGGKFWISPHRWKSSSLKTFADSMTGGTLNTGFMFWMEDDQDGTHRPQMKLNAGYIDGRVDTVDSYDYELMGDNFHWLPRERK